MVSQPSTIILSFQDFFCYIFVPLSILLLLMPLSMTLFVRGESICNKPCRQLLQSPYDLSLLHFFSQSHWFLNNKLPHPKFWSQILITPPKFCSHFLIAQLNFQSEAGKAPNPTRHQIHEFWLVLNYYWDKQLQNHSFPKQTLALMPRVCIYYLARARMSPSPDPPEAVLGHMCRSAL